MRSLLLSFSMVALGTGGSLVMAQGAADAGLTNGTEPSPAVVRAEHLTVAGALDGGDAQAPGRRCYRLNEGWDFVRGGENPPAVDGSPRQVEWGSAPLLIRVGDEPGEIRVRARLLHEGSQTPREAPVLVIPVGADEALSLPSAG